MGFRMRRSIRLGSGVRINLGRRGPSLSLGGRGLTTNLGPRGARTTIGLPGSGISYTTSTGGGRKASGSGRAFGVGLLVIIAAIGLVHLFAH